MPFKNQHPLYSVWMNMKDRCRNPNFRQWSAYGGRGINVCDRWKNDFKAFVEDMGPRPEGYSLDRINNDGNYEPGNCRWASRKEQQRNQRRAVYVEIEGARYRAVDLAAKASVKTDTILERAARGLSLEQVVSPIKSHDVSGFALGRKIAGAMKRSQTHCRRGHEFTVENTILIPKDNARGCRKCRTKAGKLDPVIR
jgi:hypothetical protein